MSRNLFAPNRVEDLPLFAPAAAQVALEARDRAIESLSRGSGEDFIRAACLFVLGFLREHGPNTSEQIVDACKAAGIVPHDDRAFGPVLMRLSKQGRIEKCGTAPRKKGHGTAGANVWRIVATTNRRYR